MEYITEKRAKTGMFGRLFSKVLMGTLFSPVFGWRGDKTVDVEHFRHIGVDNSSISVALRKSDAELPKGVVILCHPFLKYGMSYFFKNEYHQWLAQAGYHVVGFNFKGFGLSTVEGVSFSEDVTSMVLWANREYPVLPIHILGLSFGAFHGIHALAAEKVKISSVIFDSVPVSISTFFGDGLLGVFMRWLSKSRWSHITGTKEILGSLPLPREIACLFLYGNQDKYVSLSEIEKVRTICGAENVVMYTNCGHLEIRKKHPHEYIELVTKFFDAHSVSKT